MRSLAALAALLLAGCGAEREGAVLMIDHGYRLELAGTAANGFTAPDGLLWNDGALLMADEAGVAIRRWVPGAEATTLADAKSSFSSPEDLVEDRNGDIWFTDDNVGGLRRLGRDGRVTQVAGPAQGLVSTEGLALAPTGELIVGDGEAHRVFAISPIGAVRDLVRPEAGITKPESMAFDDRGNLYIADNEDDILYLRTLDGRLQAPVQRQDGFSPESVVFARGALFITDSKNGRLWRYSPEKGLEAVATFTGEFSNVQGITTSPNGDLYISIRAGPGAKRGYILRLVRTKA